jgi:hypothetical protein
VNEREPSFAHTAVRETHIHLARFSLPSHIALLPSRERHLPKPCLAHQIPRIRIQDGPVRPDWPVERQSAVQVGYPQRIWETISRDRPHFHQCLFHSPTFSKAETHLLPTLLRKASWMTRSIVGVTRTTRTAAIMLLKWSRPRSIHTAQIMHIKV